MASTLMTSRMPSAAKVQLARPRTAALQRRPLVCRAGNSGTGGVFSPVVQVVRTAVGDKEFNKLRGKAISIHSEVIKTFCGSVGAPSRQAQLVIRLAKKNGEWLGFLA